jgi:nuclear mRNA export protein SAC3
LDDCARLREVIETFPEDRHFIPSVLFIIWNEDDSETLPDDLRHMVRFIREYCAEDCTYHRQAGDYEEKGITESYGTFSVSSKTKDLDEKFGQVLSSMELDTVGGLVEIMSRQGKSSNHFGQSAS